MVIPLQLKTSVFLHTTFCIWSNGPSSPNWVYVVFWTPYTIPWLMLYHYTMASIHLYTCIWRFPKVGNQQLMVVFKQSAVPEWPHSAIVGVQVMSRSAFQVYFRNPSKHNHCGDAVSHWAMAFTRTMEQYNSSCCTEGQQKDIVTLMKTGQPNGWSIPKPQTLLMLPSPAYLCSEQLVACGETIDVLLYFLPIMKYV